MEPFQFYFEGAPEHIHCLDLGHIAILAPNGEITSKGRKPDQAMMLVPSIIDLLDGVARVASSRKGAKYRFCAVDSSIELRFACEKGDRISITFQKKNFGAVPARELVVALAAGVAEFIRADGARFDRRASDFCKSVFDDLDESVVSFFRAANLPLPL